MGDQNRERKSRFEIDLDRSREPRAFRDEQNLWRDDIRRIYRLVDRHVEAVDRERKLRGSDPGKLPNLSIAVFGPSGSGKSSLLRTLADDVGRPQGGILCKERLKKKVYSLPVMDPTTWSDSDQFLYAFLATALEEEQNQQDQQEQQEQEQRFPQGLSPVQLAFQEVNEYLRVVDDVGAPEEQDPLGMSLQKLERHTSGLRLHKALDKFIKKLAKAFSSADVVLLPVDDLDMTPTHLVKSLQTFQSFLMHPQLVPVFTFTDRMPEELIEAHYEQRLRGERRRPKRDDRLTISEQLAVQFLTRCFPVRNRIRLGPAPARVQRAIFDLQTEPKEHQVPVLELLIISSFLLFGHPDEEDAHKVRAALRPSTLRRQFQVVDAMTDCRLTVFRVPQFAAMANSDETLEKRTLRRLGDFWDRNQAKLLRGKRGYGTLADRLQQLEIGATWATIFNGAAWSLLNVHRDTLRELGLFLEDLYSWSPKELRSVVVGRILEQNRTVRRTVVDRWFNRTDYRRSQVLSLLAANIFRPWMTGEEPYGDEEIAIREQLELEARLPPEKKDAGVAPLDWDLAREEKSDLQRSRTRLTFPATEGLLWFVNVTLGFYLPQIMARNWADALSPDESVKGRIGGNGWDLVHAPINAMRVADAKQEIFSFGMLFLGPRGYRHALEAVMYVNELDELKTKIEDLERIFKKGRRSKKDHARLKELGIELKQLQPSLISLRERKAEIEVWSEAWSGKKPSERSHLLLRIWSCCGYSRSRYWAAFSLWRGLGFIGQALDLGRKERGLFASIVSAKAEEDQLTKKAEMLKKGTVKRREVEKERDEVDEKREEDERPLRLKFERLIRSHCLEGLVPGSLLDRDADDKRLLQGFPRWEPHRRPLEEEITNLARDLIRWLANCWDDRIFPLPAGDVRIGWGDCFIRRIHGEYILGSLWPRLNATYLEERERRSDCQLLARRRAYREERVAEANKHFSDPGTANLAYEERFRTTAALAAGNWSDILLEYWRGCTPVLRLLLTCPVFLKSQERFGRPPDKAFEPKELFEILGMEKKEERKKRRDGLKGEAALRYDWFDWLSLPPEAWKELTELWAKEGKIPGLVPSELCIERVRVEFFGSRPVQRHSISVERTELAKIEEVGTERQEKPERAVKSVPVEYPENPVKKPKGPS